MLSGKIVQVPVSGGRIVLETSDGERYALVGLSDAKEGEVVTVKGFVMPPENSVGIGMTGDPVFQVAMRSAPEPG